MAHGIHALQVVQMSCHKQTCFFVPLFRVIVSECHGLALTIVCGAAGGYGGDDSSGFRQTFEDTIFVSGMSPESTAEEIGNYFGSIGRIKVC